MDTRRENAVPTAPVDHLVVVAQTLAQGMAWCEATLGIVPGPGGQHPLMGTHNRLFRIAPAVSNERPQAAEETRRCSPRGMNQLGNGPALTHAKHPYAQAYFEIIAIDPDAPPPGRRRWFGIDEPALQAAVRHSPRLVHWVAQTSQVAAACAALAACGEDVGQAVAASRVTPEGELHWQITVRPDGVPQHGGALPTLIEWGDRHPTASMPDSGVVLNELRLITAGGATLRRAVAAIGATGVTMVDAQPGTAPHIEAVLHTPLGERVLSSLPR